MAEPEQTPIADVNPDETPRIDPVPVQIVSRRPRSVYAGMWGPLEIGAVAVASIALLAAFLVYFFFVIPSNRELAKNKSDADRLDAELITAKSKYGEITNTQDAVAKLTASVDDFETRFLPVSSTGQPALYQRLNGLIAAYDLVNTSGPDYVPLESTDMKANQQADTDEEKGRAKFQSLYPGVYVSTTLEGSYQNLRRFIREIETGRDFIVVSAVELAPSDTENQKDKTVPNNAAAPTAPAQPGTPTTMMKGGRGQITDPTSPMVQSSAQFNNTKQKGKMHGETVSLHIELAAYFRRPNFVPTGAQQ